MEIARNNTELEAGIKLLKGARKRIAFVPTMGALHAGHISLVALAKKHADAVVASIFVNPTQFGPNEDFTRYPRKEKEDAEKLAAAGVDLLYLPSTADIYPKGPTASISVKRYADILCAAHRPGHFDGVATVVKRLFELVKPDAAVFGEKDYQQLTVIRWLVKEFNLKIDIIRAPICRESDGLAMSSRNAYLSAEDRKKAPLLYQTISRIAEGCKRGEKASVLCAKEFKTLMDAGFKLDYLEVRDAVDLSLITGEVHVLARVFVAATIGATRLIDNVPII